jgi:hypothetical protein
MRTTSLRTCTRRTLSRRGGGKEGGGKGPYLFPRRGGKIDHGFASIPQHPLFAATQQAKMTSHTLAVSPGPWKDTKTAGLRWRLVGTYGPYAIVQRELREFGMADYEDTADDSLYKSALLVGRFVGDAEGPSLFDRASRADLWCSNCWSSSAADDNQGGAQIPYFMRCRYFSKVSSLPPCSRCAHSFLTAEEIATPTKARSYATTCLFDAAAAGPEIVAAVTAALCSYGISADTFYRPTGLRLTEEQRRSVITGAMHPKHMGRMLEAGGFEALDEVFG